MSARALSILAGAAGAMCAITGVFYVSDSALSAPLTGGAAPYIMLTMALVGGDALLVAGLWQRRAALDARGLPLAILAALAAGYLLANVVGLVGGVPGAPRVLHAIGIALGALLFLATTSEILSGARHHARA